MWILPNFCVKTNVFVVLVVLTELSCAQNTTMAPRNASDPKYSAEHKLTKMLFSPDRYQKNVRPVADYKTSIPVKLGICVMSIDEIRWKDEFLIWNPGEFDNLSWMAFPSPDPYKLTRKPAFVEISSTGHVGYYPTGRFSTRCRISLTFFPFDRQRCDLFFESWVYPIQWLSLETWGNEPIDMKDFYHNHQWNLVAYSVTPGNMTYDGFHFSTVRFSFYFQRRTLYYGVLAIFPCMLMSFVQTFSHSLPVEHPARSTLLTALYVASSVLQSALASQMPKSSDGVSLIQLYLMIFTTNLMISMLTTFMHMHAFFRVPQSEQPSVRRLIVSYLRDTARPHEDDQKNQSVKRRFPFGRKKKRQTGDELVPMNEKDLELPMIDTPVPGRSKEPPQPEAAKTAMTVADRKEKWLQFTMLLDKVLLYAMVIFNICCPGVIFGLVPLLQLLYVEDDPNIVEYQ